MKFTPLILASLLGLTLGAHARETNPGLLFIGDPAPPRTNHLRTRSLSRVKMQIEKAKVLVVDITTRAPSPNLDSDRAWILGYAAALDKPIYVFTTDKKRFCQRVRTSFVSRGFSQFKRETTGLMRLMDPENHAMEEFGLWDNLMIDGVAHYSGGQVWRSAEAAIQAATLALQYDRGPSLFSKLNLRRIPLRRGTVYLAGPEVFLSDPNAAATIKKEITRQFGLEGLFPMDNEIEFTKDPQAVAMRIFAANMRMMMAASAVVANLTPFRGRDMDQGTAFEIGFMTGLERKVTGYGHEPQLLPGLLVRNSVRILSRTIPTHFAEAVQTVVRPRFHSGENELELNFCKNALAL